ncbi:TPA: hypothetical protein ACPYZ8_005836, partial [Klebsiella pneumoniae]
MRDSSHQYVVLPEKCRVKYRNRPLKNQAITHPDKGENARRLFHLHEERIHACSSLQVVIPKRVFIPVRMAYKNAIAMLSAWR